MHMQSAVQTESHASDAAGVIGMQKTWSCGRNLEMGEQTPMSRMLGSVPVTTNASFNKSRLHLYFNFRPVHAALAISSWMPSTQAQTVGQPL
jgi:hypothetical protein